MSRGSPSRPDRGPAALAGGVIFEFIRVGDQMRVAAVDSATGTEAVIVGPASAATADLERLAMNKLRYVLTGQREAAPAAAPRDSRPGRLI